MFFRKLIVITFFTMFLGIASTNTDDHVGIKTNQLGVNEAKFTLIEYASMSCVHCANFHNKELPTIKTNLIDTGKLKFVYKDFPLDRPAMFASMIAHCFRGEKYFTVLSTLYRNQSRWLAVADNSGKLYSTIQDVLKIHGITLEKVLKCVDDKNEANKNTWNRILATRLEGQKLGVNSTPTFFLNGKKLEKPVNFELLKSLVN